MSRFPEPIKVDGLADFRAAVRSLDDSMGKVLRLALNSAGEIIRDNTVPWVPRRTGRAAAAIKMRSTQTKARVVHGGNRAPYVPWLDFGGAVGRNKSVTRRFVKEGRFIWRTMGKRSDEVTDALTAALVDVARQSGLEVSSSG